MSLQHPTLGIVGATGAVGAELIGCLESRSFPLERLRLFASDRSAGRRLLFRGEGIPVEQLHEDSFPGIDIALFSAGGTVSRRFAPMAVRQGRGGGGQLLGFSHGAGSAAGGARSQP
jgi:aspartate-semialdehyde dehydrogenase